MNRKVTQRAWIKLIMPKQDSGEPSASLSRFALMSDEIRSALDPIADASDVLRPRRVHAEHQRAVRIVPPAAQLAGLQHRARAS